MKVNISHCPFSNSLQNDGGHLIPRATWPLGLGGLLGYALMRSIPASASSRLYSVILGALPSCGNRFPYLFDQIELNHTIIILFIYRPVTPGAEKLRRSKNGGYISFTVIPKSLSVLTILQRSTLCL